MHNGLYKKEQKWKDLTTTLLSLIMVEIDQCGMVAEFMIESMTLSESPLKIRFSKPTEREL